MTRLKRILFEGWPFLLIIFSVLVFFWQFFLKGRVPLPADITVGMYFPWLDYKWGYTVGVPVKNSLLSDVVSQIYPFKVYVVESLKKGIIPLWNPFMFGGYPLLANIQVGLFNPTNLFYLFLPFLTAWGVQTAFQPLLAAVFAYFFLRSLNLTKIAGIFGALIFAFSGFMIVWLEWNVHGYAVAFLPALLYLTNRYYQTRKSYFGVLLSLALALQLFSGYPQAVVYTFLALGVFVLTQFKVWQKITLAWLFWLVAGIALASIQLLPTAELFLQSQRRLETLSAGQSFLPWRHLISFLAPDFFGSNITGNFWGKGDYTNSVGYSGLVVLILAGLAFKRIRKEKAILFFVSLLVFSLVLALPTPVSFFLGHLNGAMAATRILFLANFSLAGLAAFSLDRLWKKKIHWNEFGWAVLPAVLLASVFLGTLGISRGLISLREVSVSAVNLRVGLRNLLLPGTLAMLTLSLLVLVKIGNEFWRRLALLVIFLAATLELFRFGRKYTPFVPPGLVFPKTPVIDFLQNQKGIFRVEGGDAIPMNMLMAYNLESFSAYDPMYPQRQAQFLSLTEGGKIDAPQTRYGQIDFYDSALFDLSNICYVLAVKRDSLERADPQGNSLNWKFKLTKFVPVFEDKSVKVLENEACYPRAFLVHNYEVESDGQKIAERLTKPGVDFRKTIVLEKNPGIVLPPAKITKEDEVKWLAYQAHLKKLEVETEGNALLFVSESFYPGWEAFVDGRKTEIFRADFAFRAIFVPAGKHRIEFIYKPKSFRWGAAISIASSLFLIFVVSKKLPFAKSRNKDILSL